MDLYQTFICISKSNLLVKVVEGCLIPEKNKLKGCYLNPDLCLPWVVVYSILTTGKIHPKKMMLNVWKLMKEKTHKREILPL